MGLNSQRGKISGAEVDDANFRKYTSVIIGI